MGGERREGALILGIRRGRGVEACPVRPQDDEAFAPDVRSEGCDLALRLQRKKEPLSLDSKVLRDQQLN
jgi:hypothetical protein